LSVRSRADGRELRIRIEPFIERIRNEVSGYPTRPLSFPVLLSQRPGYKNI